MKQRKIKLENISNGGGQPLDNSQFAEDTVHLKRNFFNKNADENRC
jgi:hypothetical protein